LDCMIFTSSWACSTGMAFLRRFTDDMALISLIAAVRLIMPVTSYL
jgi:hypothetical protein